MPKHRRHVTVVPESIARCMSPNDRAALNIETAEDATARGDIRRERELQRQCESYLMRNGTAYLHLSPRAREKAGWPDLVFAVAGRPFAVELKTATGRLSDEQTAMLETMAANGWHTAVIRSYPAFVALLKNTAPAVGQGMPRTAGAE